MKLKIIVLTCLVITYLYFPAHAQFKIMGESNSFEEPEKGTSKIVQLNNGNTFFLTANEKAEITYRIYDANHKEIVSNIFTPAYGELNNWTIENVFEVKDDVVLFVAAYVDKTPTLYRLIFDKTTGKLKEEKTLFTTNKRKGAVGMPIESGFNVKKDPVAENYAIEVYNFYGDEKDKRIEIIQYDDENLETNRSFLVTGDEDEFKYFIYVDMQVLDADKVNVVLYNGEEKYFYNYRKGRMVMASIDRKAGKISYTNVEMPEVNVFKDCLTQYNVKTKMMYMLLRKLDKKGELTGYNYFITYNTTNNSSETKMVNYVDDNTNARYKERFDVKRRYTGDYISFAVNDDGSYTILYEESFYMEGGNYYSGKILIANYDIKGNIISAYITPKVYNTNYFSQYKITLYVNAGKNRYMLLNDTEKNNNAVKNGYVPIIGVSDMDAFIYKLSGDELVPQREMLFGSNENGHNLGSFITADYHENTLVTLKLSKKDSKNKAASLVWVELK